MGLRFRKSIKIAPGVKMNIGKKSVGISVGTKGARMSINSSGRRTTSIGVPGTGLSYVKSSGGGASKKGSEYSSFSDEPEEENVNYDPSFYRQKARNVKINSITFRITLGLSGSIKSGKRYMKRQQKKLKFMKPSMKR